MPETTPTWVGVSDLVENVNEVLRLTQQALGAGDDQPTVLDDELHVADTALSTARRGLLARLDRADVPDRGKAALLLRVEQLQLALKDTLLEMQLGELDSAYAALKRLRTALSVGDLADRVPTEAQRMGFTRVLFSRIQKGAWLVRSAFVADDQDMATTLVEVGTANPRHLAGRLVEGDMVRRGNPILIRNPRTDPRVHPELIAVTNTPAYVAAPVFCYRRAIGLVHADRHNERSGVNEFDRNALGVFAENLGMAFERNLIVDRLHAMRRAASDYLREADSLADDFTLDILDECGPAPAPAEQLIHRALSSDSAEQGDAQLLDHLTSREAEVLQAMAAGKTNSQIAAALFVTENTIKSHAKSIFRKLGTTTRTEAMVKYQRAHNPWLATGIRV